MPKAHRVAPPTRTIHTYYATYFNNLLNPSSCRFFSLSRRLRGERELFSRMNVHDVLKRLGGFIVTRMPHVIRRIPSLLLRGVMNSMLVCNQERFAKQAGGNLGTES